MRSQLSGGQTLPPEEQLTELMDQLCTDIATRITAVDAGKQLASAPLVDLPPNIYGADGDWEAFSTPGRDQKLRSSFRSIFQLISATAGPPQGHGLVATYANIWRRHQASCKFTYTSSTGTAVELTLEDIQARLFSLSFDPYECVELRWGARPGSTRDYATCTTQDAAHVQRYSDQQTLRNVVDRPPPGTATPIGFGPESHEDVDVPALLARLAH